MADVMKLAAELCKKDCLTEQDRYGQLLPCRKISPLEPFIKLEEYFMLERDTGKYLLYMAAIERATEDVAKRTHGNKLQCLVLGPGLGRLVRFCIAAAEHCGLGVCVHILEANPIAVEFVGKSFKKEIDDKIVHLYEPFTFHPKVRICDLPCDLQEHCGSFDVIVSELLGCFGDDEFLPELTSTLYKLFPKPGTGVMIPETWTNYLVPVSCPSTFNYLSTSKKCLNSGYTMGLPNDCVFLSNTKAVWSGECKSIHKEYCCDVNFCLASNNWITANSLHLYDKMVCEDGPVSETPVDQSYLEDMLSGKSDSDGNADLLQSKRLSELKQNSYSSKDFLQDQNDKNVKELTYKGLKDTQINKGPKTERGTPIIPQQTDTYLHGFIGYFTCCLYKDIMIDTRHMSRNRNSFHWECYFLPLSSPVLVESNAKVNLMMRRKYQECLKDVSCFRAKLWYEWQVILESSSILDSTQLLPDHNLQFEGKNKAILITKTADLSSLSQNKCNNHKRSKELDLKVSNSKEENIFCKEEDSRQKCSVIHKLSVQNRNGECDAVVLTWDKTTK